MNQFNELIRLEDLAEEYERLLGNNFKISLNASTYIEEEKQQGYMLAVRQPYKISNIKAESLQISLHFYVCCEYTEAYNDTIKVLSSITGLRKGKITSNDKDYRYFSYLDFAEPLGEPVVDQGKFCQHLIFRGAVLVTQVEGGVLIGNEAEMWLGYIDKNGKEHWGEMQVLSSVTQLTKTSEAPQISNSVTAKAFNNTQFYTHSYTFLMMKNAVCERLFRALKGIEPFGLNEEIRVFEKYPEFTKSNVIVQFDKEKWSNYGVSEGIIDFMLLNGKWNNEKPPFDNMETHEELANCGITFVDKNTPKEGFTFKVKTIPDNQGGIKSVSIISKEQKIVGLKSLLLTNGSIDLNAGAFVTFTMSLQEKLPVSAEIEQAANIELDGDEMINNTNYADYQSPHTETE